MRHPPVITWGQGEPVVLIHGSGVPDLEDHWDKMRPLAAHFQLLLLTRPGYGERPLMPRTNVEEDVQDILILLEENGGGHLVGFSYGGCVALIAATRRPDLVRSLTVIEPPAFAVARGNPAVETQIEKLQSAFAPERPLTTEEFLLRFMRSIDQEMPDTFTLEPTERKAVEAMRAEPAPWLLNIPLSELQAVPLPKLVVSGDWHSAFEAVADVLTNAMEAERLVCRGMGHFVIDIGEPFNQPLAAFLQSATNHK